VKVVNDEDSPEAELISSMEGPETKLWELKAKKLTQASSQVLWFWTFF
jgi:hypothetical protein